jgi:hypothetical protein
MKITAMRIIKSEYERDPKRSLLAIGSSESCRRLGQSESCIGAWDAKQNRFVTVAAMFPDQEWVTMPYELTIDGIPPAIDWTPVSVAEAQEARV